MEFASPSRLYGALVVYYGVLQALHLVGLVGSAITWLQSGALGPLVPPPVGGWPRQAELFLLGTGLLDAAFALMGVAFAAGQRRGAKWAPWLGTVALTGSCYSAGIYLFATLAAGAWAAWPVNYILVSALFLPAFPLFWLHARVTLEACTESP